MKKYFSNVQITKLHIRPVGQNCKLIKYYPYFDTAKNSNLCFVKLVIFKHGYLISTVPLDEEIRPPVINFSKNKFNIISIEGELTLHF
jgi:hypothetical protein